jgi:hypothetical protein
MQFSCLLKKSPAQARGWLSKSAGDCAIIHRYYSSLWRKGEANWRDNNGLTEWLSDQVRGPHETAWWFNAVQLKLGLLGKVIGFSILALQIGHMQSFDAGQTQALLQSLTGGLGVALLTTMTGLVCNILLGLQLTHLDRLADFMVSESVLLAETELHCIFSKP